MTVRRGIAIGLVTLASLLAFVAVLAIWVDRQALNTANWTSASSEMLQHRVVRDRVADYLVEELYANVDVAAEIRAALPERAQPLAAPAAAALRDLVERSAKQALARPRAQQAWENASRTAHETLLHVLRGGGPVVSTGREGVVDLDLKELLRQLDQRTGMGGGLVERLPRRRRRSPSSVPISSSLRRLRCACSTRCRESRWSDRSCCSAPRCSPRQDGAGRRCAPTALAWWSPARPPSSP